MENMEMLNLPQQIRFLPSSDLKTTVALSCPLNTYQSQSGLRQI